MMPDYGNFVSRGIYDYGAIAALSVRPVEASKMLREK